VCVCKGVCVCVYVCVRVWGVISVTQCVHCVPDRGELRVGYSGESWKAQYEYYTVQFERTFGVRINRRNLCILHLIRSAYRTRDMCAVHTLFRDEHPHH